MENAGAGERSGKRVKGEEVEPRFKRSQDGPTATEEPRAEEHARREAPPPRPDRRRIKFPERTSHPDSKVAAFVRETRSPPATGARGSVRAVLCAGHTPRLAARPQRPPSGPPRLSPAVNLRTRHGSSSPFSSRDIMLRLLLCARTRQHPVLRFTVPRILYIIGAR